MRLLGTLTDESQAKTYAAYMVTQGVSAIAEPINEGESWQIWIKEEDHLELARSEFKSFQENPQQPKYDNVLQQAQAVEQEEERKRREVQKNVFEMRGRWKSGGIALNRPLTLVLIGICIVVALLSGLGQLHVNKSFQVLQFREAPAFGAEGSWVVPVGEWPKVSFHFASILQGQVWRLLTPIFLHFGIQHLIFNMLALFFLGSRTEDAIGALRYTLLIVVIGVGSNAAEALAPTFGASLGSLLNSSIDWGGGSNFGGMSGVIYGIFGFMRVDSFVNPKSKLRLSTFNIAIFFGWLLYCIFMADGVANYAHVFGLIIGGLIGFANYAFMKK